MVMKKNKTLYILFLLPFAFGFTGVGGYSDLSYNSATLNWVDDDQATSYSIINNTTQTEAALVSTPSSSFKLEDLSPNTDYSFTVRANWADSRIADDANTVSADFTTPPGVAPVFSGEQVAARKDGSVATSSPSKGDSYRGGIYLGELSISGQPNRFVSTVLDKADIPWSNSPAPIQLCDDLIENGQDDWRLPNISELQKLYTERSSLSGVESVGTLESTFYWSGSADGSGDVLGVSFLNGSEQADNGSTFSPSTGNVRCVRSVNSATTGEVDNLIRAEYFSSSFYEVETASGTNTFPFTFEQVSTGKLGVTSCDSFSGNFSQYDITINLSGFGQVQNDILKIDGTCDGVPQSCFISGLDTGGEQRLMEATLGGCSELVTDFEDSGSLTYSIYESLVEVESFPSPQSDFFNSLAIRDDDTIDIVNNNSLISSGFSTEVDGGVPFTESEVSLKSCVSQNITLRSYDMTLEDDSNLSLQKFNGICDSQPVSCAVLSIPDTVGGTFDLKLMEDESGGCDELSAQFQLDGSYLEGASYKGMEVFSTSGGIGADYIKLTQDDLGDDYIEYYNSGVKSIEPFTYTVSEQFSSDISVKGCYFKNAITSFSIEDVSGKDIDFKRAFGTCDEISFVDCIIATSDGSKSYYTSSRGGCVPIIESYQDIGEDFVTKVYSIKKSSEDFDIDRIDILDDLSYEIKRDTLEFGTYTEASSSIVSTGFELRSCYNFIGDREEKSFDLNPDSVADYSISMTRYDGQCDGEGVMCYLVDDRGSLYLMEDEDGGCSRFLSDFVSFDTLEGVAGQSLPDLGDAAVDSENFYITSQTLNDGLNEVTKEPLPDSDWTVEYSEPFAGNCNAFSDHVFNDGDLIVTANDYLSNASPDCSMASHPEDTLGQIEWDDLGIVRKAQFGTEILLCGRDNACDISMQVTSEQDVFSYISPQRGEDGTSPGRGRVFAYDFRTVTTTNERGIGGAGGSANLASTPVSEKYCIDLKDYNSEGGGSEFAAEPSLSVKVVDWIPFQQGPDAAQGLTPDASNERSYIYKGLSDGMLHYIKRDNVYLGEEWDE